MLLILIFLLIVILILGLYFLFKLVKWILKKKIRITWASVVILAVSLVYLIDFIFFTKMEFIPSKVYPDFYLVKNPVNNTDSIQSAIKKMVLNKVNGELLNNNEPHKFSKTRVVPYHLQFYEYYTGTSFLIPFGEAGTTHFIEHKEDSGGFISEEITHYNAYRIAEFHLKFCKNDSLNYVGTITYYQNWKIIKTDTIINQCQKIIDEATWEEEAEAIIE